MKIAPPSPAPPIEAHIQHFAASLAMAQTLVQAGRIIDLSGLDAAAGLLCAKVLDLPPEHAATCRPALIALVGTLATLAGSLQPGTTLHPRQKAASCHSPSAPSSPPSPPSWASSASSSWPAAPPG